MNECYCINPDNNVRGEGGWGGGIKCWMYFFIYIFFFNVCVCGVPFQSSFFSLSHRAHALFQDRIMRSANCTPVSSPSLPPTHNHPLWQVRIVQTLLTFMYSLASYLIKLFCPASGSFLSFPLSLSIYMSVCVCVCFSFLSLSLSYMPHACAGLGYGGRPLPLSAARYSRGVCGFRAKHVFL